MGHKVPHQDRFSKVRECCQESVVVWITFSNYISCYMRVSTPSHPIPSHSIHLFQSIAVNSDFILRHFHATGGEKESEIAMKGCAVTLTKTLATHIACGTG